MKSRNKKNGNRLLDAIGTGNVPRMKKLLEKNPDLLNYQDDDGWSLVYRAVIRNNEAMVLVLVEAGADVNQCENDGWSPVYRAVSMNDEAMVRVLVEAGADVNQYNNDGWSPVYRAVSMNNEAMVRVLVEAGADVSKEDFSKWNDRCISYLHGISYRTPSKEKMISEIKEKFKK